MAFLAAYKAEFDNGFGF